jgi:hypothetical protein
MTRIYFELCPVTASSHLARAKTPVSFVSTSLVFARKVARRAGETFRRAWLNAERARSLASTRPHAPSRGETRADHFQCCVCGHGPYANRPPVSFEDD